MLILQKQKKAAKEQAKARAVESARSRERERKDADWNQLLCKLELLRHLRRQKGKCVWFVWHLFSIIIVVIFDILPINRLLFCDGDYVVVSNHIV